MAAPKHQQGLFLGRSAQLSDCGTYRYTLRREWADGKGVAFLMLNPRTADASQDDPTIRKCIGFARHWGYGRLSVVNLFALRSTDPRKLARNTDPIGPLNDYWIKKELDEARLLVCAWGCQQHLSTPSLKRRVPVLLNQILTWRPWLDLVSLGTRQDGAPRHPLMLPYATERIAVTRLSQEVFDFGGAQ